MARVSSVEPCMFCGNLPCTCNAKKEKIKPKPRTKRAAAPISEPSLPVEETVEVQSTPALTRQSMVDRRRARAAAAPAPPAIPVRARPKVAPEPELSPGELAMLPAIRLLSEAFEIVEEDLEPWRKHLARPPSARERALSWRSRVKNKEQ